MNKISYLRWDTALAAGVLLVLAGCAAMDQPWRDERSAQAAGARLCAQVFEAVDDAVTAAGVGDAEAHRIPGFPYLRVDRFSAQFRDVAAAGGAAQAQWLARLQTLDRDGRGVEISNLPDDTVRTLEAGGRAALLERLAQCADTLREYDRVSPQRMAALRSRAQVPDRYHSLQRVAGLYALTRVPFYSGISQWQREALQDFRETAAGRAPAQPLARYAYAQAPPLAREQIAALLRRASDNALRIPRYSREESAALAAAYAPVFEIETGGAYDRFGRLHWTEAQAPVVDATTPLAYYRIAYTRHSGYPGQTLTQLVYTVWFAERPADHAFDVLAGKLDGIVLRVTLSPDGEPLLYDSIHPCGCYHLFFPTARMQAVPAPDGMQEWVFIPATLPVHAAGARLTLRVATRTHYIVGVALDAPGGTQAYALAPEEELRSLPRGGHNAPRRSIYGPHGLVPGTERGERYLFWPMGIPSAGAMRQWGHHATAFVGRRHFDDADLLDKRFRLAGVQ